MAYQQDFSDDEDDKKEQGGGSEQVLTSETSSTSTAPSGQPSPGGQAPKATGSGYTNLSQYVDANKPQAASMAGKVTSGIDQRVQSTVGAAQGLKSEAGDLAQKNTVTDRGVIGNLAQSPTKFAESEWQNLFKDQTAGYKGPKSAQELGGYQGIDKQYKDLDTSVNNLSSNSGLTQAAKETFSPLDKQYTRGENTLDSFLLGTGGGAQVLQDYTKGYKDQNLGKGWQDLVSGIDSGFKQAETTSNKTKADTEAALTGSIGGFDKKFADAGTQLQAENASKTQSFGTLQAELSSDDPQARAGGYAKLGIDPQVGEWLRGQGYNVNQLASATGSRALGDLLSDDDVTGYGALKGLAGQASTIDFTRTGNSENPFAANSKAITSGQTGYGLDTGIQGRLTSAQDTRQKQYSDALGTLQMQSGATSRDLGPQQLAQGAATLGLSPEDFSYAVDKGLINPTQLVQGGAALNKGDVATDAERSQWSQIMADLGLSGSLQDTQDEGEAFRTNTTGLQNSILEGRTGDAAAIAEAERQKEAEARAQTIEQEQADSTQAQMATGRVNVDALFNSPSGEAWDEQKAKKRSKEGEQYVGTSSFPKIF